MSIRNPRFSASRAYYLYPQHMFYELKMSSYFYFIFVENRKRFVESYMTVVE
jgi:hypothetical protein